MAQWRLKATNTHLYRGARLSGDGTANLRRGDTVVIEFADLGIANARIRTTAGARCELAVQPHRTRRGTAIDAKIWLVERLQAGRGPWSGRIVRRLTDGAARDAAEREPL